MKIKDMTKSEFIKSAKQRFWEINGKLILPTQEELNEVFGEIWDGFNR